MLSSSRLDREDQEPKTVNGASGEPELPDSPGGLRIPPERVGHESDRHSQRDERRAQDTFEHIADLRLERLVSLLVHHHHVPQNRGAHRKACSTVAGTLLRTQQDRHRPIGVCSIDMWSARAAMRAAGRPKCPRWQHLNLASSRAELGRFLIVSIRCPVRRPMEYSDEAQN